MSCVTEVMMDGGQTGSLKHDLVAGMAPELNMSFFFPPAVRHASTWQGLQYLIKLWRVLSCAVPSQVH
jgi:hypothetical protein